MAPKSRACKNGKKTKNNKTDVAINSSKKKTISNLEFTNIYFTPKSSTSKIRVAPPGIAPGTPPSP